MILYYSACGNSRYVAEELGRLAGDDVRDLMGLSPSERLEFDEDDVLGIVCPVYAWAVPRLVVDTLSRMVIVNRPAYCYLACTCGDSVGCTPERLGKTMKSIGLHLDAAFSFVMPETYVNLPGFNLDDTDGVRRKLDGVRRRLPMVAKHILTRDRVVDVTRGKMPWVNSYIVNPIFYRLLITDRRFWVTEACVSCGRCVEECPLHNIELVDGRPQWKGDCTNCMSCYHHCPVNAIQFGRATKGKGQYLFSD